MDNPAPTNDKDIKIAIIKAATEIVIARAPMRPEMETSKISSAWQALFDAMSEKALKK